MAANLAALGLHVRLVGTVGADEARLELLAALSACGDIDSSGVIVSDERQTTRKLRIIGEHQQIVRVDTEDAFPFSDVLQGRCLAAGCAAVDDCDLLVISDYGKGVCSDLVLRGLIDRARSAGKPVVVDPKRRDLAAYRGASFLTPNRQELSNATGLPCESDDDAASAAEAASEACGASVLLTRSEKGMSLFPIGAPPVHLPTVAQKVFDVSGAGDTVIAVFAAALAAGFSTEEQLKLANHAAGVVVSKLGTASISQEELAAALAADLPLDDSRGEMTLEDARTQRLTWAAQKLTVGFTNGCFDLLHPGHVSLLRQASAHCDRLIVGLNSDSSVRRLKGTSRPIQNERARAIVVGAVRGVSAVVIFEDDTPLETITILRPDLLVKGADYEEDEIVGWDAVKAGGGRLLRVDLESGHSTTGLVSAIANSREVRGSSGS